MRRIYRNKSLFEPKAAQRKEQNSQGPVKSWFQYESREPKLNLNTTTTALKSKNDNLSYVFKGDDNDAITIFNKVNNVTFGRRPATATISKTKCNKEFRSDIEINAQPYKIDIWAFNNKLLSESLEEIDYVKDSDLFKTLYSRVKTTKNSRLKSNFSKTYSIKDATPKHYEPYPYDRSRRVVVQYSQTYSKHAKSKKLMFKSSKKSKFRPKNTSKTTLSNLVQSFLCFIVTPSQL